MQHLSENGAPPRIGRALGRGAAALLFAAGLFQSDLAHAAHGGGGHGGGGGFHGGGFHGGGFHGGGFHGGGFHGGRHVSFASLHHNGFGDGQGGHWNHGWRNGRYGWWWGDGLGWTYYPDYGYYGGSQPYASRSWYYCSNPAGYYPYVTQCNTGWQTVPAS
jgi:hypothetical protein